jgi:hypothetical protein
VTHVLLNFQTAGKNIEPILKDMGFPVIARNELFSLFSIAPNLLKLEDK